MDRKACSHKRMSESHIEELIQAVQQRQQTHQSLVDVPELRMAHDIRRAYQTETREDGRSLDRVLVKLLGDQAAVHIQVPFLPSATQQQERISTMQHSIDTRIGGKTSRGWQRRAAILAAVLFLTLLVGGLLTVLGVVHQGQGTLPTSSVASNVITSVTLSDNAIQSGQVSTVQHFAVGQTVWLTSMINVVKMTGSGTLTLKWYEDNHLYATSTRNVQAPQGQAVADALKVIPVRTRQVYTQPGDAKVAVYWNGQLVTTLHFVVGQKA
jgi:hypothetical protein